VRFLTRRSHVIYTRKISRKNYIEKDRTDGLRHSTNTKVTARGSAGYPRVRHSTQKSPKGTAGPAQQVCKIEVFIKRLSVQKSPKGAAGLAQQVRKIEVFIKKLSMQKSPKGAAGLAQQVRKIEVFLKRLSVQESPKGAAGLAQRVRKIESTLHPCKNLRRKNYPRKDRLQVQPDRHNKRARPSAQVPYGHSRISESTQPHNTNYSYIHTARASHLTLVQPSG
jgi:hypothetical protein